MTDPKPKTDPEDELAGTEQPFVTHLMELRDRLIRSVVAIGVVAVVLAIYPGANSLYDLLAAPLVVSSTILFFVGVAFSYYFVFGTVFSTIQKFAPQSVTAAPDIEAYLSFVLTMFLAFGMAFEVPIAVVVLARLGVVSIEQLKSFRGYFIVLAFVIAAIVTPPDVVSQLALAIPMCLLYEVGIWAARLFIKHTKRPEDEAEPAAKT